MKKYTCCYLLFLFVILMHVAACNPVKPTLAKLTPEAAITTTYTTALVDLNTVLEVYLPPDYPITFYYVKPITDATGISHQGGEIPPDITSLVRDAVSQVHHKVRYVEQYDESDAVNIQVLNLLRQSGKIQTLSNNGIRPTANFTIGGRISQFDRNIESTSSSLNGMGNFGEGLSRTDISASIESSARLSRLSVSFQVYDSSGVSIPGKFGASTEVGFAKNGIDIGFAIFGNGFGFGSQATAMHGRHLALQMMSELSVVQIIGRTLTIPYWRVGAVQKIFKEDNIVISSWRKEYDNMIHDGMIIPFMQSQCIANGDNSVSITGILDERTKSAFNRFANKYNVKNSNFPNFELYKALELNRILDRSVAASAWSAYAAYKGGARPAATPVAAPVAEPHSASEPAVAPRKSTPAPAASPRRTAPARSSAPQEPDPTEPLNNLLP